MTTNPQLENGYIRIANELYQAMYKIDLSASEIRVLHFIVYQTFGYNKKSRRLSLSYIANGTEVPIGTVRRSLKNLIDRNIVLTESEYQNESKILSINKRYSQWRPCKNERSDRAKMSAQKCTVYPCKNERSDRAKMDTKTIQSIQDRENKTESSGLPPTCDEIREYCEERNYTFDPEKFYLSYEATGWRARGSKITNWKALADIWQKTEKQEPDEPETDEWGNPIKKYERQ